MGAAVAQWKHAVLQINSPRDQSCTWGVVHSEIHLIRLDRPRPSIALQCRIVVQNTLHFHFPLFREINLFVTPHGLISATASGPIVYYIVTAILGSSQAR